MSADGKLFDIENSLKQKHLDLVKQKSYYELKRLSVGKQFKQNLLSEMTALLPDHSVSRLTETVQCITNAVSREAKSNFASLWQ